jgi:hypothetical protein
MNQLSGTISLQRVSPEAGFTILPMLYTRLFWRVQGTDILRYSYHYLRFRCPRTKSSWRKLKPCFLNPALFDTPGYSTKFGEEHSWNTACFDELVDQPRPTEGSAHYIRNAET